MKFGPVDQSKLSPRGSGWHTYSGLILHGGNRGHCLHAPRSLCWCPWKALDFVILIGCPLSRRKCLFCCPCPFQKRGSIQAWPVSGLANNRRHPQQLPWCPLQSSSTNLHCSHRSAPYKPVGKCMCPEVVPRSWRPAISFEILTGEKADRL